MPHKLGFIGGGNMAEAIARAATSAGVLAGEDLIVSDPSEDRRAIFRGLGATVARDNRQVVAEAQQVMLAVKPQMFPDLAHDLAGLADGQVLISIMAGVGTKKITDTLGKPARVVRVMPNTPVMIGMGMAGVALGRHAEPGDDALTLAMFSAGGEAIAVDEAQLDAITAVSGSGPAYVFYLAEAMEAAARDLGLGDHAPLLVSQTLRGAAELLAKSDDTAAELRAKVTSKGGTTFAATEHLDQQHVMQGIQDAIAAAAARSRELGE